MKRHKKVLIIGVSPINNKEGAIELFLYHLAKVFKQNNWDIDEYCFDVFHKNNKFKNVGSKRICPSYDNSFKYNLKSLINFKRSKKELQKFKESNKYDLILYNIIPMYFKFENPMDNEYFVLHNDLSFYNFSKTFKNKLLCRFMLFIMKIFSGIVEPISKQKNIACNTKKALYEIEQYCGRKMNGAVCIPFSTYKLKEIKSFKKPAPLNKICYIGRIEQLQKNMKFLIKVAKYLNVPVDVYGRGSKVNLIKKAKHNIKYCGQLNHSDVFKTFGKYKASINVSEYEGMSFSSIESVCSQTPCIHRNTWTNASFFTNNSKGLLLDKNLSPKQCAEKINEWLQKSNFEELSKLNKNFALKELSIETFEKRWTKFLKSI